MLCVFCLFFSCFFFHTLTIQHAVLQPRAEDYRVARKRSRKRLRWRVHVRERGIDRGISRTKKYKKEKKIKRSITLVKCNWSSLSVCNRSRGQQLTDPGAIALLRLVLSFCFNGVNILSAHTHTHEASSVVSAHCTMKNFSASFTTMKHLRKVIRS